MSPKNKPGATPKLHGTKLPPYPSPADPEHDEWLIDEASDESFPASDPSSATQPHVLPGNKKKK